MSWNLSQQSLVFAFYIFLLDSPLAFYQLKFQGGSSSFWQHHMYHLYLPLDRASIVIQKLGSLGLPWEALFSLLGELWLRSPDPAPPILVCPSLFPVMYSF